MGIINYAKNVLKYLENTRETGRIVKKNKDFLNFYEAQGCVTVPLVPREQLNEMEIIRDKDVEYDREFEVKEPLLIYVDALSDEQKRQMPPFSLKTKIDGPVGLNPKYYNIRNELAYDSMNLYMNKAKELGLSGRGKWLEVDYHTEDFDMLDESFFDELFQRTKMTKQDISNSSRQFNCGWPLSYVHKIDSRPECTRELENSVNSIKEIIWGRGFFDL